ncbi:uncharacterized protein LOC111389699 [Olea europaea var. sylvestris]|uniref:uncharacterized protein LOC111389699 n=1 Tax=Olea europaea var. sylvestris TaxID=158386 RepID=UPI000C1D74CF|nr:uncharacterized protein LOC111389699 [Olea europaea var. sylvestris]
MYPSRGGSGYGQQQPYSTQSSYANQNLGGAFPGSSVGGSDGSLGSRHALMLGGTGQESDPAGYRAHGHSAAPPSLYGGQYSSIYGSSSGQEVSSSFYCLFLISCNFDKQISISCINVILNFLLLKNLIMHSYYHHSFT